MQLIGKRVVLRALRNSDAQSLYENAKDKEISFYTTLPNPYTLADAQKFIRNAKRDFGRGAYEFCIELDGKVIGMMSLTKVDSKNMNAEVGYWLGMNYWKKGFASEALKLLVHFGFTKLNLVRIYAKVLHENIDSSLLLEKNGFKLEGRLRKNLFRNGIRYDTLLYGFLKDEYAGE